MELSPRQTVVQQWIEKADIDYRTAERLCRDEAPIRESIAFHCQQAIEKYLKGTLTFRGTDFAKIRDLRKLLNLVCISDAEVAEKLRPVEALTPFGVDIRYPGDTPEVLPGQEREFFALTTQARDLLRPTLVAFTEDPHPDY